ncbi:MAG: hypothetical protein MJZ37_03315 [Bacilli bacterium]|nr:hypothetical protein [Bacilli bacterium]
MPLVTLNKTLSSTTRATIRDEVINWFLAENPGTGTGALASKVHYTVDSYNGISIELHRPATLNKGFDFTVHVNGMFFKKNKRHTDPSHNDIFLALSDCRNQNTKHYDSKIKPILLDIFNCQNVNFSSTSLGHFTDYSGTQRPIEIIILCVKWLFIEQDMTYWNWSGRQMLFDGLKNNNLI